MSEEKLINAIAEMEEEEALKEAQAMLDSGVSATDLMKSCRRAMEIVGERFADGEYFVPQLIMAGEIMTQISEMAKDELKEGEGEEEEKLGKILMGTVDGDIHDIGKGIVNFNLDVNGFKVIDLGEDVKAEEFIKAIKEHKPDIVGMSCLLTVAFDSMKNTIEAIDKAGLRDQVKIMIGGAPINDDVCEYSGADDWGKDAVEAVSIAKKWMEE